MLIKTRKLEKSVAVLLEEFDLLKMLLRTSDQKQEIARLHFSDRGGRCSAVSADKRLEHWFWKSGQLENRELQVASETYCEETPGFVKS